MSDMPLFLSCTDLHFTSKTPACRIDQQFQSAQIMKLIHLLEMARSTKFQLVLCAGDFFDSATRNITYDLLENIISCFKQFKDVTFLCVAGNHDMRFRQQTLDNTPLRLIASARPNFRIVSGFERLEYAEDVVCLYASPWEVPLEQVIRSYGPPDTFKVDDGKQAWYVGLTHRTIFESSVAPWADGFGLIASEFIRACNGRSNRKLDYIITGDNHECFMDEVGDTVLVNSGPMLRNSIDKMDYQPRYAAIYDCRVRLNFFPIVTDGEAFNMNYVNQQKEIKEATKVDFDKLITEVDSAFALSNDFPTALRYVVKKKHPELLKKLEKILE